MRGNVVLIDFWGTFCETCKKAFPRLESLRHRYAAGDFDVVAISEDGKEDEDEISIFAESYVVFGAHALALVLSSLETRVIAKLGREICQGARDSKPVLLALAHTEPGGGSDVEDVHDIQRASIASRFARIPGGYRVNARKVFISNGSIARYNVLTACSDPRRPLKTMAAFVIPHDAPGFGVGRVEHKMGQRGSSGFWVGLDTPGTSLGRCRGIARRGRREARDGRRTVVAATRRGCEIPSFTG